MVAVKELTAYPQRVIPIWALRWNKRNCRPILITCPFNHLDCAAISVLGSTSRKMLLTQANALVWVTTRSFMRYGNPLQYTMTTGGQARTLTIQKYHETRTMTWGPKVRGGVDVSVFENTQSWSKYCFLHFWTGMCTVQAMVYSFSRQCWFCRW